MPSLFHCESGCCDGRTTELLSPTWLRGREVWIGLAECQRGREIWIGLAEFQGGREVWSGEDGYMTQHVSTGHLNEKSRSLLTLTSCPLPALPPPLLTQTQGLITGKIGLCTKWRIGSFSSVCFCFVSLSLTMFILGLGLGCVCWMGSDKLMLEWKWMQKTIAENNNPKDK